jgi:hypothetical protein
MYLSQVERGDDDQGGSACVVIKGSADKMAKAKELVQAALDAPDCEQPCYTTNCTD